MSSMQEKLAALESAVQQYNTQADAILAAAGEGALDPDNIAAQIEEATQDAIQEVLETVDGLDVSELYDRTAMQSRLTALQNAYDPYTKFVMEFFSDLYTAMDTFTVGSVATYDGDDSVDVADTSDLEIDKEYFITDGTNSAFVRVAEIFSSTRFRASEQLTVTIADGTLYRSTWQISSGVASLSAGDVYYSVPMNLDAASVTKKAFVVRTTNPDALDFYFKQAKSTTWVAANWEWKRSATDEGYYDAEFAIPVMNDFEVKLVASGSAQVRHIVGITRETGLQGVHRPPVKPSIVSPADGATDVDEQPSVTTTAYSHPNNTSQDSSDFQMSSDASFAEEYIIGENYGVTGISCSPEKGVLTESTTYYVRARHVDVYGGTSEWSDAISFTTAASFITVDKPTAVSPAAGEELSSPDGLTLVSSDFSTEGGTDTHANSQWQIASDTGFTTMVQDSGSTATDLTSYAVPDGTLSRDNTYYWRVRHEGTNEGWSDWSSAIVFSVSDASIVGIALVSEGGGAGTWQQVDVDGNNLAVEGSFFDNHNVFGGIAGETIDSQDMVKIPKFWFKQDTAPSGSDNAGRKCWWVSDADVDGFDLHPAFMDADVAIDQFWVGKYQGVDDGTKLGSFGGVLPKVGETFTSFQGLADARNEASGGNAGQSGWQLWDFYKLGAIQMLALIEMGGSDSQTIIGEGRVSESSAANVDATDVATATYRGIVGLWGNVYQAVDGLVIDGTHKVKIWDKSGNKTWITTGITTASADGWSTSVHTQSGDDYDLSASFLPSATDGTESNGTYADYLYASDSGEENVCYMGGHWALGSYAGLFNLYLGYESSNSSTTYGARLAKV
jgi:hypothetical protein